MQPFERFSPLPAIDQVVPLRNQVVDRTARGQSLDDGACVTERHAAIHATGALLAEQRLVGVAVKLAPHAAAFDRSIRHRQFAREIHKTSWLTHLTYLPREPGRAN